MAGVIVSVAVEMVVNTAVGMAGAVVRLAGGIRMLAHRDHCTHSEPGVQRRDWLSRQFVHFQGSNRLTVLSATATMK